MLAVALAGPASSTPAGDTRTAQRLVPGGVAAGECGTPLLKGSSPGTFVRSLNQCTERYSTEISCNGYDLILSRVDRPGLDFWDVLVRVQASNATAEGPQEPLTAIDGTQMDQISHNAAYMCSSEGKLVVYGGRIKPIDKPRGDPKMGHYPGLLRIEGTVSASGVEWSEPLLLLDEQKARSLNCKDARRNHEDLCEFDGKLSVVEFKGYTYVFARLNPGTHDYRHVQMTRSPIDKPTELEPFQPLEFDGYQRTKDNNIYFMAVQARKNALVALFPAVIEGRGGIHYSESPDGVHWTPPLLMLASKTYGPRTDDYPVDGFVSTPRGLRFAVDHGIVLEHGTDVDAEASQNGQCTPPHTCRYEVAEEAIEELMDMASFSVTDTHRF